MLFVVLLLSIVFLSFVSYDSFSAIVVNASFPYIIIGISQLLIYSTMSMIIFNKVNFTQLIVQYNIPVTLIEQVFHTVVLYVIFRISKKHHLNLSDKEYQIAGILVLLVNMIPVCLIIVELELPYHDLMMVIGSYCAALAIIILLFLLYMIHMRTLREVNLEQSNQILQAQLKANNKIIATRNELMKIRHDLKHFINIAANEESLKSNPDVQRIIRTYDNLNNNPLIKTHIPAVDYVLNEKIEEAKKTGIDVVCMLNITHDLMIDHSDLCLLLSNLLDNAITHIGKQKQVRITMQDYHEMFLIEIVNSIDKQVLDSNNEIVTDNDQPHFGIISIRQIIAKYSGFLSFAQDDRNLTVSVLFPL